MAFTPKQLNVAIAKYCQDDPSYALPIAMMLTCKEGTCDAFSVVFVANSSNLDACNVAFVLESHLAGKTTLISDTIPSVLSEIIINIGYASLKDSMEHVDPALVGMRVTFDAKTALVTASALAKDDQTGCLLLANLPVRNAGPLTVVPISSVRTLN